jgi:hypothetical protein
MVRRIHLVLAITAVGVLVAAGPASSQDTFGEDHDRDDFVVLKGDANVPEGDTAGTVVVFDGTATIAGSVEEVVAFNAPVTVTGSVEQDVFSFNRTVTLEDGASVGGDVISRHEPVIDPGATVGGDVIRDPGRFLEEPFPFLGKLAAWLAVSISVLALGLLLLGLVPRGLDAVEVAWQGAPWPSVGWGVLLLIGLPALAILAFITLVGIPFGLGLALGLFLIYATGYTIGTWVLGRRFMQRQSRAVAFLVGLGILRLIALIPILAGLVAAAVTVIGLGAVTVAVWRARRPAAAARA